MDKEHFRFYNKVRIALHIQSIVIHNELYTVFDGREEVEDEERPGRPIMEITSENIEEVRDLINDDSYVTIDEL
ncbi:unnamed protein product [Rotaria sp. Silwood2]|nr:unnamed protein product [Rotaria sp. Silwood2]CAF3269013.1 unnamed protein product [Rotaria sp. Silwood2]CAF3278200.1 unnamed protein product [Rotaria sp. Silwood2]CAF3590886.1 unnamed protein product [Rotaria sp. Silwood2]CAF4851304.1 unnamed protein product [Rotaria sp. Silwood2]